MLRRFAMKFFWFSLCFAVWSQSLLQAQLILENRFEVSVEWTPFGEDQPMAANGGFLFDSFAYFHFNSPGNIELIVKVLDACNDTDHFWVFAAGMTDVEVTLTVTDMQSGVTKQYSNPPGIGNFMPILDTNAFATCPVPPPVFKEAQADAQKMIGLLNNRFQVQVTAADDMGEMVDTTSQILTNSTASFSINGDPRDPSIFVKVVDGTAVNGSFWVYFSSINNRALTYTITDTETDVTRTYEQPAGSSLSFIDREFQKADNHRWVFPWISNNNNFRSRLIVNNYSPNPISVTMIAMRGDGTNITVESQIAAGGFLNKQASDFFAGFGAGSGYTVSMTSQEPGLAARWVTNNLGTASSGSPSQGVAIKYAGGEAEDDARNARLGNALMFGYLPAEDDTLAAPVIVNTGTRNAQVTLYFFRSNGLLLGTHEIPNLVPLRPFAAVLSDLLPGVEEDVSMVAYTRDQPLTGVVFTFNGLLEPSLGNAQAIPFVPPGTSP